MVATSIQRSPGSRVQGGRVKTTSGVSVGRQAATAFADMRAANGWVASTTASMRSRREDRRRGPSAPPKPPMRCGIGAGAGLAVAPASDRIALDLGVIGEPPRERARFRRAAENEQAKALQGAAP